VAFWGIESSVADLGIQGTDQDFAGVLDMLMTKALYEGVHVLLDTDDPELVTRFERECRWDSPLLKLEKEKKTNGKQGKTDR
jgi:hypothetical protein